MYSLPARCAEGPDGDERKLSPTRRVNHRDFLWCPRHAGTRRQFECTSLITAEQVKQTIRRIPGFREAPPPARVSTPAPPSG
jgi:hypothetical protein